MRLIHFSILLVFAMSVIIVGLDTPYATAESTTTVTPINEKVSLKKTVIPMYIPEDNVFPWGAVRGAASDYAERYPVIIQIFKGEDPVYFAQVNVKGDGSFEHKFRIRNVNLDTGETINIFEGDYTVSIFRVIPNNNDKA